MQDIFKRYGSLRDVWVARKPPGFAFLNFDDPRDAQDAVDGEKNNKDGWRVEISQRAPGPKPFRGDGGGGRCCPRFPVNWTPSFDFI